MTTENRGIGMRQLIKAEKQQAGKKGGKEKLLVAWVHPNENVPHLLIFTKKEGNVLLLKCA